MRLVMVCCLLILSLTSPVPALASDDAQVGREGTDTSTSPVSDAQAYLANIDRKLALASDGQYGNLKRGSGKRLEEARDRIAAALDGQKTVADLPLTDRIVIQNAEDEITSILQTKERDRMVCRRDMKTGTRLATTECLTIGEREARAATAAEDTSGIQRNVCYIGEGQRCE